MDKNKERMERVRDADAMGDQRAGDEGVDDPAMSRAHRDDMTATRMHGDKLGAGKSTDATTSLDMNEDISAGNRMSESGQRMKSQRSMRTNQRANDEMYDDASNFTGQGDQKEGSEHAEGTGYTEE